MLLRAVPSAWRRRRRRRRPARPQLGAFVRLANQVAQSGAGRRRDATRHLILRALCFAAQFARDEPKSRSKLATPKTPATLAADDAIKSQSDQAQIIEYNGQRSQSLVVVWLAAVATDAAVALLFAGARRRQARRRPLALRAGRGFKLQSVASLAAAAARRRGRPSEPLERRLEQQEDGDGDGEEEEIMPANNCLLARRR